MYFPLMVSDAQKLQPHTTLSDAETIKDFLHGNSVSYETLVQWMRDVLAAQRWSGSLSDDDIIADTTIKLLQNFRLKKFEHRSSLKTYVQRITRHTLIDYVRAQARVRAYRATADRDPTGDPTPLDIVEREEELFLFQRIMGVIAKECSEMWAMVFDGRIRYAEIARRLGVTEATVKMRMFRCKEEAIRIRETMT